MRIAGQAWRRSGAWEWGVRRFRAPNFLLLPSPYIYGLARPAQAPADWEGPRRAWDFGIQWGFWGIAFGLHWRAFRG